MSTLRLVTEPVPAREYPAPLRPRWKFDGHPVVAVVTSHQTPESQLIHVRPDLWLELRHAMQLDSPGPPTPRPTAQVWGHDVVTGGPYEGRPYP